MGLHSKYIMYIVQFELIIEGIVFLTWFWKDKAAPKTSEENVAINNHNHSVVVCMASAVFSTFLFSFELFPCLLQLEESYHCPF